ncbi:hypothetical protein GSI_10567 [Ganoderma sinense ZZ0214-1]|uniref:Uncharacterized protein n=1 Tax=Ganoderma sinense ZZ0214-1 TaxID=1077348 RepID=A0A2G8S0X5_9APHY|nr:hypothetical protein GSI_10567 [Ganoderma sinense ZZ0214-1]
MPYPRIPPNVLLPYRYGLDALLLPRRSVVFVCVPAPAQINRSHLPHHFPDRCLAPPVLERSQVGVGSVVTSRLPSGVSWAGWTHREDDLNASFYSRSLNPSLSAPLLTWTCLFTISPLPLGSYHISVMATIPYTSAPIPTASSRLVALVSATSFRQPWLPSYQTRSSSCRLL